MKFVIAFSVSAFAYVASAQETVTFECVAAEQSICYFNIRHETSSGERKFTLKGGEKDNISGVVLGEDTYCMCVDRETPSDWAQCKKTPTTSCKTSPIARGTNR